MSLYDVVGLVGVALILGMYAALQFEKIAATSFWFSFLNFVGSVAIFYSLLFQWNLPSVIIEVVWSSISVYGIWKFFRKRFVEKWNGK